MNALILSAAQQRLGGEGDPTLLGRELITGNMALGYYGEYTSAEVITGNDLAAMVQFTQGTAINSSEGWFGFALDGKRLLISKKTRRQSVTWANMDNLGIVFGREVTIQGNRYLCRLPKGVTMTEGAGGNDPIMSHGSEWNRLMYRVALTLGLRQGETTSSEGIITGPWGSYTNQDLDIKGDTRNLCQERRSDGMIAYRANGVTFANWTTDATGSSQRWRPVLELID